MIFVDVVDDDDEDDVDDDDVIIDEFSNDSLLPLSFCALILSEFFSTFSDVPIFVFVVVVVVSLDCVLFASELPTSGVGCGDELFERSADAPGNGDEFE